MKLYHGTTSIFQKPNLEQARINTDFGPGFYLTNKERLADDWMKGKPNKRINIYDVTLSDITTCKLHIKRFNKADVEWAKFVYNNRRNKIKKSKYSLIIGPIADNGLEKWFSMIEKGEITWEKAATIINFNRYESIQFCFMNDEAIKLLKYDSCK